MSEDAMSDEPLGQGLLKTSAAAEAAGVSKQSLQYYIMVGLIEPVARTSAGQLFDEKCIERIRLVRQLNESGYPLREIREIFLQRDSGGGG